MSQKQVQIQKSSRTTKRPSSGSDSAPAQVTASIRKTWDKFKESEDRKSVV